MAYGVHRSDALRELFHAKPFQGADPATATFLFMGSDANFADDIESSRVFGDVCDYLRDGVAFWRSKGRHHPFLLDAYAGSGRRYHRRFEKIGFKPEHAAQVSFVEAFHLPTFGSGQPFASMLQPEHVERLEDWVMHGASRYVFIPKSVLALLHRAGGFPWLDAEPAGHRASLPVLHESPGKVIFAPYHLSYRYVSLELRDRQLADIGALIGTA